MKGRGHHLEGDRVAWGSFRGIERWLNREVAECCGEYVLLGICGQGQVESKSVASGADRQLRVNT